MTASQKERLIEVREALKSSRTGIVCLDELLAFNKIKHTLGASVNNTLKKIMESIQSINEILGEDGG